MVPFGVDVVVGTTFVPSLFCASIFAPMLVVHDPSLMPVVVHETAMGLPRGTDFGCAIICALARIEDAGDSIT